MRREEDEAEKRGGLRKREERKIGEGVEWKTRGYRGEEDERGGGVRKRRREKGEKRSRGGREGKRRKV